MILEETEIEDHLAGLEKANQQFSTQYPGDPVGRKPVHTVYGGAQLFIAERAQKIGESAMKAFDSYVSDFAEFARILKFEGWEDLPEDEKGIQEMAAELEKTTNREHPGWLAYTVFKRVQQKLKREAVEDFRIDFEDGFGKRSDEEEDHYAKFTAREVIKGMNKEILPLFIGIRIKPLTEKFKYRSIRTLNIFLSTMLEESHNRIPNNFVITLPKVTIPEEVATLNRILDQVEDKVGLDRNTFKIEIMIETPQSIINSKGEATLPLLIGPARKRITGAHFGVYDYTASVDIIAKHQEMDHIACDFARHMMKVAVTGTGIRLSDGATNILPVGPHRPDEGEELIENQLAENLSVVHNAWKKGFGHIMHSLVNGYYQGWDLHPAQLPIRYAAVYSFFLSNLQSSIDRVASFVARAAQATLTGDVFDDAATALALLNYFNLGLEAQAITEEEAMETGLTIQEIQSQSFDLIMDNRIE